ncbi:efflux RND transporter periplasmic adaptor subunit [Candidatus Nitrospira bockiana]
MVPRNPESPRHAFIPSAVAPVQPEAQAGVSADALPFEALRAVLDATATALDPDGFRPSATALVTTLATKLACDRVSLGILSQGRLHVRALSHSAQFNHKTDLLRTIAAAMEEAVDQDETIAWPPDAGRRAQITRAHEELARRYYAGALCSVPLRSGGRLVGVLTFERAGDQVFDRATVELCEGVGAFTGPILDLKRRDDEALWTKAYHAGREGLARVFGPGHLALKLVLALLIGVAVFLATATGEYRVTAKAVLEGEIQQAAAAPFDGYLDRAMARAGDVVKAGQVLATLQDRDLKLERLKWLSQHDELTKEYRQAMADRDAAKVAITTAQLEQADAQLKLATEKLARTQVTAPFDGVVVTGDWSQHLGSPVEQGQVLFEVAPLDSYRVVLEVDERDVAAVKVGQRGQVTLAAMPGEAFGFAVTTIMPVSTARDGRNYFRVEGRFETTPPRVRPAMEGVGKVSIDERRLAWIWTHDVIDWVRLKLWALLP